MCFYFTNVLWGLSAKKRTTIQGQYKIHSLLYYDNYNLRPLSVFKAIGACDRTKQSERLCRTLLGTPLSCYMTSVDTINHAVYKTLLLLLHSMSQCNMFRLKCGHNQRPIHNYIEIT